MGDLLLKKSKKTEKSQKPPETHEDGLQTFLYEVLRGYRVLGRMTRNEAKIWSYESGVRIFDLSYEEIRK